MISDALPKAFPDSNCSTTALVRRIGALLPTRFRAWAKREVQFSTCLCSRTLWAKLRGEGVHVG